MDRWIARALTVVALVSHGCTVDSGTDPEVESESLHGAVFAEETVTLPTDNRPHGFRVTLSGTAKGTAFGFIQHHACIDFRYDVTGVAGAYVSDRGNTWIGVESFAFENLHFEPGPCEGLRYREPLYMWLSDVIVGGHTESFPGFRPFEPFSKELEDTVWMQASRLPSMYIQAEPLMASDGAGRTGAGTYAVVEFAAGPTDAPVCDPPHSIERDGRCVPSCGAAGGDTCGRAGSTVCEGRALLEAYDCGVCCRRAGGAPPPPPDPPAGCGCRSGADNYCDYPPSTPGCEMTYPGGYCDPNGDGSYDDANWSRGWHEHRSRCG